MKSIDLTNKKFNRLTVLSLDLERSKESKRKYWFCSCSCGSDKIISVTTNQLTSKHTQSCGCLKHERICERNIEYCTKINRIEVTDNSIKVYDDKYNYCLIDKEDYSYIKDWYWRKDEKGYWRTNSKDVDRDGKTVLKLHQEIAKIKYGNYNSKEIFPDHLDRNKDNNKKNNLILKPNKDNMKNRGLSESNTSGKTGVSYDKNKEMYVSYITVGGKRINLGSYEVIEDAIKARKQAEIEYGFTCDEICCGYDN